MTLTHLYGALIFFAEEKNRFSANFSVVEISKSVNSINLLRKLTFTSNLFTKKNYKKLIKYYYLSVGYVVCKRFYQQEIFVIYL